MRDLDETLISLGEKLDALELSSDEHDALMAILDTARGAYDGLDDDEDEVVGFTFSIPTFRSYVPTFGPVLSPQFPQLEQPLNPDLNLNLNQIQQNWGAIPPPMP